MARRPLPRRNRVASLHTAEYERFVQMLVGKRILADLTQQQVADALGWSQSLIAKIEKFERRVDVIELLQLASVIGFDAVRLVRELRAEMKERGELTQPYD